MNFMATGGLLERHKVMPYDDILDNIYFSMFLHGGPRLSMSDPAALLCMEQLFLFRKKTKKLVTFSLADVKLYYIARNIRQTQSLWYV